MDKLSPKESVEGAETVLRGSVRAPEGFSEGKPKAAKLRERSPRGFARGKSRGSPHTAPQHSLGNLVPEGTVFSTLPKGFSTVA